MEIGVIGYSAQSFDEDRAKFLLDVALSPYDGEDVILSSGLTDLGIPAEHGFQTKGVTCAKAANYEQYPCDFKVIEGSNWGDESVVFLSSLDLLIRVGGGKQSFAEVRAAKDLGIPCVEL